MTSARSRGGAPKKRRPAASTTTSKKKTAAKPESAWEMVYRIVRRIPKGRVTTYGRISEALGRRLSAAAVGWAMAVCPEGVPWWRVVNASGGFSTDKLPKGTPGLQGALLRKEGLRPRNGRVDLEECVWIPPRRT